MLKKFAVQNYKNVVIKDALIFNNLNIFIGSNNSGKSNLIEAMSYPIDLFRLGFEQSVLKRRFRAMLNRYTESDRISFEWTINTASGYSDLTYTLSLLIPEQDYHCNTMIDAEKLAYAEPFQGQKKPFQWVSCHGSARGECFFPIKKAGKTSSLKVEASLKESIFNQIDRLFKRKDFTQFAYPLFYGTAESVKTYFGTWKYYQLANISVRDIKSYSKLRGEERFVNEQCSNFANVLRVIFPKHPSFKMEYLEQLRKFMPVDSLDYEIVGDENVNIFLMIKNRRFELNELSDGTVRLMVLLFLLCSPEKPKVLFIDEPELNLHPAWLRELSNIIRDASREIQIFLSTHSPELLDPMTYLLMQQQANVYIFNRDGSVIPLTLSEELKSFINEGWELGDLYRVGDPSIGGWPW